jgi:hypothetical protein
MPEFGTAFSGLNLDRKVSHQELVRAIRFMVAGEEEVEEIMGELKK